MLRFSPPRSFYAHFAKSVSNIVDTLSMFLYSVMLPQCLLHLLLHNPHWLGVVIGTLLGSGPSAAELCVLPVTERVLYVTGWNFGLLQKELWKCLISGITLLKYKHLKSPNTFSFYCNIKTRLPCQRTRCIPKKGFVEKRELTSPTASLLLQALSSSLGPLQSSLTSLAPLRGLDAPSQSALSGSATALRGSLGSSGGLEPLKKPLQVKEPSCYVMDEMLCFSLFIPSESLPSIHSFSGSSNQWSNQNTRHPTGRESVIYFARFWQWWWQNLRKRGWFSFL